VNAIVLVAGAGTAVGLWLILIGWFPRPPDLEKALDAPYHVHSGADVVADPAAGTGGWTGRWGRPAVRLLRRLGLPRPSTRRDLATLDKPVDVHLAEQATACLFGLLLPPAAAALLGVGGVQVGVEIPVAASLVLGVAGFLAPELSVHSDAAKYRAAFLDALSAFLDLVSIGLASGSGIDQALDDAARVGSGPAFTELRYALREARLARVAPWDILAALGRRLAVTELVQLAASVGQAGTEGAKIRASLRARAKALRARQLTVAEGEANAATERMALPIVMLFAGFLIFLGYPALHAVLTGLT
jgi:Flp pilus assembly protein TadB